MKKQKQPEPEVIKFENHLDPAWCFRVNLNEGDVRRLNDGIVPEWLRSCADWWLRPDAKPSDVPPKAEENVA